MRITVLLAAAALASASFVSACAPKTFSMEGKDAEQMTKDEAQCRAQVRETAQRDRNIEDQRRSVFDGEREVGPIEDVQFGAGEAPLLVVGGVGKLRYEIPFAEAYLEKVDLDRKQVRMRLPEGLLEVNAPLTERERQSKVRSD